MQTYAIITKSHLGREGPGGIILGFLFYGCTLEAEGAASEDVGVREGATTPLTRRKGLGAGFLFQRECAAVLEVEGGAPEGGGAKLIVGCSGADGIEAEGGEDVPCRHLSGIVVAREPARCVVVLGVEDMAHPSARLIVSVDVVVKVGYLMAGFVSMPVESLFEHRVELLLKPLRSTHHLDECRHIVRHIPRIVTRGTFSDVRLAVGEVSIVFKLTPNMPSVSPTCLRIDDVQPVDRTSKECVVVGFGTEVKGELSKTEVVVGIFECS